jgi:opacity protein-like surface antigen
MRNVFIAVAVTLTTVAFPHEVLAQKHELGLTLGRISGPTRTSSAGDVNLDSGIALQANYGYRLLTKRLFALSAEVHFLANGQREVRSQNMSATRDVATAYVTPGVRVKVAPLGRFSPYVVAGGGYALYEQSFFRIDGRDNPAPRFTHRGALTFGGGVDTPLWRWVSLRFEVRDFYTGNPSLNTTLRGSGQHNVVAGGGLVLNWGRDE